MVCGGEGTVKGPGGECESAVLKIMMFRSNYLHLSDTSGMAILWEVTGGAAFSVGAPANWISADGHPQSGLLSFAIL